jgi:hypothetical protein
MFEGWDDDEDEESVFVMETLMGQKFKKADCRIFGRLFRIFGLGFRLFIFIIFVKTCSDYSDYSEYSE